ncbi:hypothetical protein [Halobacteriovorax sp. ZH4_bin.1]|uniref:hypothetical protein n=1 Tax=unclassified Halobacteriovorax TaxID=2639665 RepID=UPI003724663F
MKKLLLASALLMGAFSTQAARVQFNFDVYSSGSSIYPCNAGIKHKEPRGQVCYNPNTYESCTPKRGGGYGVAEPLVGDGDGLDNLFAGLDAQPESYNGSCDPQTGEGCDCVCTGEQNGDHEATIDFMKAKITKWKDHGDPQGYSWYKKAVANNHTGNYATLLPHVKQFDHRIKELTVNLSSERYGAEYFVDICYRATQIDFGHKKPKYKFERKVTVTDLKSPYDYTGDKFPRYGDVWANQTYQELANLKVKSEIFCVDKGYGGHYSLGFAKKDLSVNDIADFTDIFNKSDLKGCMVRYTFKEKTRGRDPIDTVRRWKLHGANICTDTAITSTHLSY